MHRNVINRWPLFPEVLKVAFKTEFSNQKLTNPQQRFVEEQWQRTIAQVRDALVICPACKKETFVIAEQPSVCISCKENIDTSQILNIGIRKLVLTPGTELFIDHDNVPDAKVIQIDSKLWLKNVSGDIWRVITPSGNRKDLPTNESVPVRTGLKIRFKPTFEGEFK